MASAFSGGVLMIPAWFTAQMARMADLRNAPARFTADGKPVGDPNIVLRMWWEGCQGLPQDVLEAAVTHAIVTRTFFPTPADLREDADVAYRRPVSPEPAANGCAVCLDTGWAPTAWGTDDAPRAGVIRCDCWFTNPVLVQRRAAQVQYAKTRKASR